MRPGGRGGERNEVKKEAREEKMAWYNGEEQGAENIYLKQKKRL